jgi:hypothetical protein
MGRIAFATAVLLTSTFIFATDAYAQVAGQWTLELGQWQAGEGRQVRIPGENVGTLDITIRGDSAFAQLRDGAPEAQELEGRVQGSTATLFGTREARVNRNGEEAEIVLTVELEISVTADEASGIIRMRNGAEEPVFRTFKGRAADGGE